MRAACVNNLHNAGGSNSGSPLWDKVAKYGLQGLCLLANDTTATAPDYQAVRDHGLSVWTLRDPRWQGFGPISLATAMVDDLRRFAPNGEQLTLCADIEIHDPNYVIAFYLGLQKLLLDNSLGTHRLCWTLEGHQGGWFTADLIGLINSDPLFIVLPQQYASATLDLGTVEQVRTDITERGVNSSQVKIVQRAGELTPTNFPDGAAWTLDEGSPWGLI